MVALQIYDLLIEILLLLPVKSVFRFKVVSKAWNLWVTDPSFRDRFVRRLEPSSSSSSSNLPLLGFFEVSTMKYSDMKKAGFRSRPAFLPTSKQGRVMPKGHKRRGFYLGISNGLILSGYHPKKYYVCNPITNQCFPLPIPPPPSYPNGTVSVSISYNVNDGSYVVIRNETQIWIQETIRILMYSSRTGQWDTDTCLITAPEPFYVVDTVPGTDSSGIILWWAYDFIAAYDHKKAKDKLWLIRSPYHDQYTCPICTMLPDGELQCGVDDYSCLYVFVLNQKLHNYSYSHVIRKEEWRVKLVITYGDLCNGTYIDNSELYFRLVAFHPQNPNIVYRRYGTEIYEFDATELVKAQTVQIGETFKGPVRFSWTSPSRFYPVLLPYVHPIWPPSPSPN